MSQQEQKKPKGFANKSQDTAPVASQATEVPSATSLLDKMESKGKVKVIHGANDDSFEVVGKKVKDVRAALVDSFNIPADATALVNGNQVDGEYVLQNSETLEFLKASGVKGAPKSLLHKDLRRKI